jgi:ribosomal protein S18 acetylase RimI-like enzyme
MLIIKNLISTPIEQIHASFLKAFSDYQVKMQLSLNDFNLTMLARRGLCRELSFGVFEDDELVGITLNGLRNWNGKKTVYDICTGFVPEARGKGLAKQVFEAMQPSLAAANVEQYLLEVLQENAPAIALYKKAGFEVTREFVCYRGEVAQLDLSKSVSCPYEICEVQKPDWNLYPEFWSFQPSWQNSIDSLKSISEHIRIFHAVDSDRCVGYGVIVPSRGDVPQLAVHQNYRRQKIGTALVKSLSRYSATGTLALVNNEKTEESVAKFCEEICWPLHVPQFEMVKRF